MKTASQKGNALLVALIMIVVISGFVGVSYVTTDHSGRSADRSRDNAGAQAAAEGALEYAFAMWRAQTRNATKAIPTLDLSSSAPSVGGHSLVSGLKVEAADEYGVPTSGTAAPPLVYTNIKGFKGWQGQTFNYVARAQTNPGYAFGNTDPNQNSVRIGVRRQFQYSEVPLFQAMYFFENDLEIYKPATMIVGGLVHTNSKMWVSGHSSGSLTFQGNVSYAGAYSEAGAPFGIAWSSGTALAPVYTSGKSNQLSEVGRMEPLGDEPAQVLNTTDSNPNNDSFRELIEPPNTAYSDPPEIANRRLYNKAGIRIRVNGATVTVTGANGTSMTVPQQTAIAGTVSASTTITDQREGVSVDVRSLDISALRTQLQLSGVTGFNGVLYIDDVTPRVSGNMEPKAIRLTNGGILPDAGLTVVSENPVYIQGDYNTGSTSSTIANVPSNSGGNPSNTDSPTVSGYTRKPSAIISDAVMFLSNSWLDGNASSGISSRIASHTTYNTAIISGFMPSGYQPPSGSAYGYSGGANNFPRFLEDWTSKSCTYFGSMVELFQSKTFTGYWQLNNVYRPPLRCWNFDSNFIQNPPNGTPTATTWSRGTWAKWSSQN
jgi:hypothetical protein